MISISIFTIKQMTILDKTTNLSFIRLFIRQVIFWLIAYGVLFTTLYFTVEMITVTLGLDWNIDFSHLLLFFLSFGLITGIVLSLVETILKRLQFKTRSLAFNSLYRATFYFIALWLILNVIRNVLNDYSDLYIEGYPVTTSNSRNFDIIVLVYTLFMIIIISFINEMVSKNSPGFAIPLILGKYRYPCEENRVFIFLDLKGSTSLAEEMGHIKYSSFLQESIMDVNVIAKKFKANIYQYVGDEVVLTWKTKNFDTLNAIQFLFAINRRLKKKKHHFQEVYEAVPFFRAGVHEGMVTAIEIGDLKREIAFHGDTMNVCARVQGLCKNFDERILITGKINSNRKIAKNYNVVALGAQYLEGRENPVEIFAVK